MLRQLLGEALTLRSGSQVRGFSVANNKRDVARLVTYFRRVQDPVIGVPLTLVCPELKLSCCMYGKARDCPLEADVWRTACG